MESFATIRSVQVRARAFFRRARALSGQVAEFLFTDARLLDSRSLRAAAIPIPAAKRAALDARDIASDR